VQLADGSLTGPLNYLGNIPTLPLPVNLAVTVVAFFFLERFRTDGGEQEGIPAIFPNGPGADKLYPGGKFDPLGLASDPLAFEELKVKEIKNGRLAMVSMLAFAAQAATTHEGPVANLIAHLSGPFGNKCVIPSIARARSYARSQPVHRAEQRLARGHALGTLLCVSHARHTAWKLRPAAPRRPALLALSLVGWRAWHRESRIWDLHCDRAHSSAACGQLRTRVRHQHACCGPGSTSLDRKLARLSIL